MKKIEILKNIKNRELIEKRKRAIEQPKKYNKLKERIQAEFKKISENDEFNKSIDEIYKANIYSSEYSKEYRYDKIEVYCENDSKRGKIEDFIKIKIEEFKNTNYRDYFSNIKNDKELADFLNYELKSLDRDFLCWCFYLNTYGKHIFISEWDSYMEIIIIKFKTQSLEKYFDFNGNVHPFIQSLETQLRKDINNINYDEVYRNSLVRMDSFLHNNTNNLNQLSLLKYEGECNKGLLIYSNNENQDIWNINLKLNNTIKINEYKKIRKLLEASGERNALLLNKNFEVFAFGDIRKGEKNYKIKFIEELTWKVSKDNKEYITMSKLQPLLPSKSCGSEEIIENLKKVFNHSINNSIEKWRNIINYVKQQKKGTILVISQNAEEESERLKSCSIKVEPTEIRSEIVELITSIDGALLLDENGICYSIGAILDGEEIGKGDSGRGARYNSALRYYKRQEKENKKCAILVISEDGYINSIPESYKHSI